MNGPMNPQFINGTDGKPAFVVIRYNEYIAGHPSRSDQIPRMVVERMTESVSAVRAWRERLGLAHVEVSTRMGLSQFVYAQQEAIRRLRNATIEKFAIELGIRREQLDV